MRKPASFYFFKTKPIALKSKLGIQRYFSRVRTPKDDPEIERFNQPLEYEWLAEYDFNRPHQSLAYLAAAVY